MTRAYLWLPLTAFVAIVALIGWSLWRPVDRTVRSALIDKPLPAFTLPPIAPGKPGIASSDFGGGRPRLINVFASWCIPCAAESEQLMKLKAAGVEIDAIAVRDKPADIARFLARYGDPYRAIGDDPASRTQLALGSAGVPESFVVDGRGRIVRQHVGEIRADDVPGLLATIAAAR